MKLVTRNGEPVGANGKAVKAPTILPEVDTTQAQVPDIARADEDLQQVEPAPLWDEGISTYLLGEYERRQAPLNLDDLCSFTVEQAIRISDILETLFLLAIYGEWTFTRPDGRVQKIDSQMLDALYERGRLAHDELDDYRGEWRPVRP